MQVLVAGPSLAGTGEGGARRQVGLGAAGAAEEAGEPRGPRGQGLCQLLHAKTQHPGHSVSYRAEGPPFGRASAAALMR